MIANLLDSANVQNCGHQPVAPIDDDEGVSTDFVFSYPFIVLITFHTLSLVNMLKQQATSHHR